MVRMNLDICKLPIMMAVNIASKIPHQINILHHILVPIFVLLDIIMHGRDGILNREVMVPFALEMGTSPIYGFECMKMVFTTM